MADCRTERHEFDPLEQEQDCLNTTDQLGPRVSVEPDEERAHLEL